ncbi:restriction endonuclease [Vibrio vulnificus]|nr:restriction endonuclease [Vibrio vulnificus]EJD0676180.1 hypothetical protein [Vibrio vulnificus]EJZ7972603.1 hypothetical protein [Vibrio vulnificus]
MKLTASNLAKEIDTLSKANIYDYPNSKTTTKLAISRVELPEGPIYIKRFNPAKGETLKDAKEQSISSKMLWRLASALVPNKPVNIDRVFGASYNTRSALEAILLHTPNFYLCYPGRLERIGPHTEVKEGHKHILWDPSSPHATGLIHEKEVNDMVIAEVDREVYFDSLMLQGKPKEELTAADARRHAQIQILLIKSAEAMGLKSWVAKNDHSVTYDGTRLIELDSVVKDLSNITALQGYSHAGPSGELIDCIWISEDEKRIPAIIEVEHSTGVTSGLTRMKGFMKEAPELKHMTYIICAPDEIREQVVKKSSAQQFRDMDVKFLPYSAVEDLYLLTRRKLRGIDNISFFHTFLEDIN